jgi:hypothetical protein
LANQEQPDDELNDREQTNSKTRNVELVQSLSSLDRRVQAAYFEGKHEARRASCDSAYERHNVKNFLVSFVAESPGKCDSTGKSQNEDN